jgi:hypothetical protein
VRAGGKPGPVYVAETGNKRKRFIVKIDAVAAVSFPSI